MKVQNSNKKASRFAPWKVLGVLSLLAVMVFVPPSAVFAQNYELSQDCETALVGTNHTIMVKVTDDNGGPVANLALRFNVMGVNPGFYTGITTGQDGTAELSYTGANSGVDSVILLAGSYPSIATTWTHDAEDPQLLSCVGASSKAVTVGGRVTLNAKKWGAVTIALCAATGTDALDVYDVDPDSLRLVGVAPWHSLYKDSRLCSDGRDGFVDLVLLFKSREVVKALEDSLGRELEDGEEVALTLTGNLYNDTSMEGEWLATIKKECDWKTRLGEMLQKMRENKKEDRGRGRAWWR